MNPRNLFLGQVPASTARSAGIAVMAALGAALGVSVVGTSGCFVQVRESAPQGPTPATTTAQAGSQTSTQTTVTVQTPQQPAVMVMVESEESYRDSDQDTLFGATSELSASFVGHIFHLPHNTRKLPDLGALGPVGTIYTRRINISPRSFNAGFPGVTDRFEWFAIRYTATAAFPMDGRYRFRINADDGAILRIDGRVVVNNDGIHAPRSRSGIVELTAGPHEIQLDYFQGPRHHIALQLFWTPPGGRELLLELATGNVQ